MSKEKIGYVARKFPYTTLMSWEFYYHKHSFWEIIICLKGTAYHYVDDVKHTFCEGDIIIMKPDNTHDYKIVDKENYSHYDLYSNSDLMKKICDTFSKGFYESLVADKTPYCFKVEKPTLDYLEYKLSKLSSIQSNPKFEEPAAVYHKNILKFIISLIMESNEWEKVKMPSWLSSLLSAMSKPEIICGEIADVVKLSNYTHGHLCKLFKKYMGTTLKDYFTRSKIDYATVLLKNKDLAVIDISLMLGYDSFSHFIRLFKTFNGITPKQYRKTLLK